MKVRWRLKPFDMFFDSNFFGDGFHRRQVMMEMYGYGMPDPAYMDDLEMRFEEFADEARKVLSHIRLEISATKRGDSTFNIADLKRQADDAIFPVMRKYFTEEEYSGKFFGTSEDEFLSLFHGHLIFSAQINAGKKYREFEEEVKTRAQEVRYRNYPNA